MVIRPASGYHPAGGMGNASIAGVKSMASKKYDDISKQELVRLLESRDRRDATRFGLVWEANESLPTSITNKSGRRCS
jgi:hypothetical protein